MLGDFMVREHQRALTHTWMVAVAPGYKPARLVTVPTRERPSAHEAVTQQETGQLAMLCQGCWRHRTELSNCLLL